METQSSKKLNYISWAKIKSGQVENANLAINKYNTNAPSIFIINMYIKILIKTKLFNVANESHIK